MPDTPNLLYWAHKICVPGTQKFSVPQSMPSTLKSVLGSVHTLFGVHIGTILHTLFGMHCIPIFLQCNNQVDFVCLFVCLYIRLFQNNFEVQRIKYMSEYTSNWCYFYVYTHHGWGSMRLEQSEERRQNGQF